MSERVAQMPRCQKHDPNYKALLNYFEPLVGYSEENRRDYSYLLVSGFLLKYWTPLKELIATSNEPFDWLVKSLTKKESSVRTRGFLLYLVAEAIPEILFTYFSRQVSIYAAINFLGPSILVRLGEEDNFTSNRLWTGQGRGSKPSKFIKKAIEAYWECDDSIFKARNENHNIRIKYSGTTFQFSVQGAATKKLGVMHDFTWFKDLVVDIVESTDSIEVIRNNHGAEEAFFIKIFEYYSPIKVLNTLSEELERMIQENIPIVSIYDAYYSVFWVKGQKYKYQQTVRESNLKEAFGKLVETKIKKQIEQRKSSNINILRQRKESFPLVYLNGNLVKSMNINIEFNTLPLFDEWAEYAISCGDNIRKLGHLVRFLNYIAKCKIDVDDLCTHDIHKEDIVSYLDSGVSTQLASMRAITGFRAMVEFLIDLEKANKLPLIGILPAALAQDISKGISIKKPDVNNRQPIPDNVFDQIMLYIEELEPIYKNAFILSAAVGLRPNELEGIIADSVVKEGSRKILVVWQFKVQKAHMQNGNKPIRNIPLYDESVINAFMDQVKASAEARERSGVKSIFIQKRKYRNSYGVLAAEQLKVAINKLIKRHNICDTLSKELWHYTPYQLRVSLIVEMIESGASEKQIKAFFGWLADETMKKAYYMARKLKLMEMNTAFFEKEFSIKLTQNTIDQYSEEELQEIVAMFYATSREMMYGRCMRHPSQGICGKLHEASACAPCHNLKVDFKYRKQWEVLYANQYVQLRRLRIFYEQRGHQPEQYEKYEFYIVQSGMLDAYFSVLLNIDK